jgi:hypothetical protein
MAHQNFHTRPIPDGEVLRAFRRIWEELGSPPDGRGSITLFDASSRSVTFQMTEGEEIPALRPVIDLKLPVAKTLSLMLPSPANMSVSLTRQTTHDDLHFAVQDESNQAHVSAAATAVRKAFGKYQVGGATERVLGREFAEYYNRREEVISRLEETTQRVLEQNVQHREMLDSQAIEHRRALQAEFDERADRLRDEIAEREGQLRSREEALAEERAKLDDRTNTHARRQLREELKKQLKERSEAFSLSKTTNEKRTPVVIGFGLLFATLAGAFVAELFERQGATVAFSQTEAIVWGVRLTITAIGLAAAILYFIRWNDQWLQRHAAEEFRQARMALDVDRASWIVEMALEWKEEKGTQIPAELVDRLSRSLFLEDGKPDVARHPAHDAGLALLRVASGAKIPLAGGGELTLDPKGLRKLSDAASDGT